eukprot:COSAG06_NODE_38695_length_415_cov_2.604361_1_plen_78_part_10
MCPEPVLVKRCVLYFLIKNGRKVPFSHLPSREPQILRAGRQAGRQASETTSDFSSGFSSAPHVCTSGFLGFVLPEPVL